jgi:DNA invertase Pin-like site-specific DNA recombinase
MRQETESAGGRAAQYVRMSKDRQKYSIEHQAVANAAYALEHRLEIVRTYADPGISGLRLHKREGLKQLLADVLSGAADFSVLLVYDVSRWGRFQDPDESAHYEFICKAAGVRIEYCAEPFDNDGSLASSLVKHIKRAMAAEYSRDLSAKISRAQWRLAAKGFWQGGPPGFALRRGLLDASGAPRAVLEHSQRKCLASDRVVLVAGPPEEIETVRRIFRLYLVNGLSGPAIARTLNDEGVRAEMGGRWSPARVRQVLTSEKYVGVQEFGKTTDHLQGGLIRRERSQWLRTEGVLDPIVPRAIFDAAQRNAANRCHRLTDQDMLQGLADLFATHGRLTARLIDDAEHLPCAEIYRRRFGGLLSAYARVGYEADHRAACAGRMQRRGSPCLRRNRPIVLTRDELLERLEKLYQRTGSLSVQVIEDAPDLPGARVYQREFGTIITAYALVGYTPTWKQRLASEKKVGRFPIPAARATVTTAIFGGLSSE